MGAVTMSNPRILWMGTPVVPTFPDSPGNRNSDEKAIEDLANAGFVVIKCETVDAMMQALEHPINQALGRPIGAVISGALDSMHTAFVTRFRRAEQTMFLAVYDRDAALDLKLRTMLKRRHVDVVTCWSEHLVYALKGVVVKGAADQALQSKILTYRTKIHEIFISHDKDKSGMIESEEQAPLALDVAKLLFPVPGEERNKCLDNIWETMTSMDKDSDKKISWEEFWRFVTKADEVPADAPAPKKEQPLVKFSAFALVVLQRADGSFCLVDTKDGWWLIGGEVNMGENPEHTAMRLAKEQAGIDVRLEGVLRVEFDQRSDGPGARLRTIYLARALNDYDPLKTIPDELSLGAVWCDGTEVVANYPPTQSPPPIPLAGSEPAVWFDYVLNLGPVFPLEVFTEEGKAPFCTRPTAKAHSPFGKPHCQIEMGGLLDTNFGPVYPNSP